MEASATPRTAVNVLNNNDFTIEDGFNEVFYTFAPGPLPRGSEYQNPCRGSRLGQSGQADRRSRTGKRYHSCARTHRRVHRRRMIADKGYDASDREYAIIAAGFS